MAQVSLKNVSGAVQGGGGVLNFNLEVRDREFAVLAGRPGCGASTLLRLMAGLDPLTSGEITVGTRPVHALPPKARELAMVFAHGGLFPHWTAARNIAFGLKGQHFPQSETEKRVRQAAEVAGADALLDRRASALSPLETVRVAWARAIIRQPKALLMDDPLAVLDAEARGAACAELVKLQERLQTTLIYATHDPLLAMTLGHRVALLEEGALRQFDPPAEIYRQPANRFAAGFLGRMNFLAGRLRMAKEEVFFKETGGTVELKFAGRLGLSDFVGKEVILGVRPEAVKPVPMGEGRARNGCGQGVVDHVEATGPELFYTVQTGAHALIIRQGEGGEPAGVGRRMSFDIDLERVHLFDAETSARIP